MNLSDLQRSLEEAQRVSAELDVTVQRLKTAEKELEDHRKWVKRLLLKIEKLEETIKKGPSVIDAWDEKFLEEHRATVRWIIRLEGPTKIMINLTGGRRHTFEGKTLKEAIDFVSGRKAVQKRKRPPLIEA